MLEENDWDALVRQIRKGRCSAFLGAGINEPYLPLGREIAQTLAERYDYPFDDTHDLIRVSQFVATTSVAPLRPKEEVAEILDEKLQEAHADVLSKETPVYGPDSPIGILAELPFRIYITTNYDPLVHNGLLSRGRRSRRELFRWNKRLQAEGTTKLDEPTKDAPLVFHLHGMEENSMVLTEDDYVAFLVHLRQEIIPAQISAALVNGLLFIGYSLQDWNFRVLHRALLNTREVNELSGGLSVQMEWEEDPTRRQAIREYLEKYFGDRKIRIYWGPASQFLAELRRRC